MTAGHAIVTRHLHHGTAGGVRDFPGIVLVDPQGSQSVGEHVRLAVVDRAESWRTSTTSPSCTGMVGELQRLPRPAGGAAEHFVVGRLERGRPRGVDVNAG